MIHHTEAKLGDIIIGSLAAAELARGDIALALSRAEEDIPPAAAFKHTLGDLVMLMLVAVVSKLRAILIPLEISNHLIAAFLEIGVVRKVV